MWFVKVVSCDSFGYIEMEHLFLGRVKLQKLYLKKLNLRSVQLKKQICVWNIGAIVIRQ